MEHTMKREVKNTQKKMLFFFYRFSMLTFLFMLKPLYFLNGNDRARFVGHFGILLNLYTTWNIIITQ